MAEQISKERLRKARTKLERLRGIKKKKIFYPRSNDKLLNKELHITRTNVKHLQKGKK